MTTLLSLYIHHLDPVILDIPGTPLAIRWYGLSYVAGFVLGYLTLLQLSKRHLYCVSPDKLGDFITMVCLFGVLLGGRLGELFFYWLPEHGLAGLWADPLWVFRVWEGGMASHGGILAVFLVTLLYARQHKYSLPALCDGLAIVAPIGLCFGRLANFLNGELYGRPCPADSPLAVKFPQELYELPPLLQQNAIHAIEQALGTPLRDLLPNGEMTFERLIDITRASEPARNALAEYLAPRYPSQLFEAAGEGLIIFLVLITLRFVWKKAPAGIFSALFCFMYAAARCISECFKQPDAPTWGDITRGQYLSFVVVAMGVVFLITALRNRRKSV